MKEPNPHAHEASKTLIADGKKAGPDRKTFIYVKNRLEGNAFGTIDAMFSEENDRHLGKWSVRPADLFTLRG